MIPANVDGPFLIVATGGSYVDEATAETVALGVVHLLGHSMTGAGTVSGTLGE